MHGGKINVTSKVGAGTTFLVLLQLGYAHLPKDQIKMTRSLTSTAMQTSAFVEEALRWLPDHKNDTPQLPDILAANNTSDELADARILIADLHLKILINLCLCSFQELIE